MLGFLKLSWRDLWRNRRRTILTGLVMTFSVLLLVFSIAMGDGAHDMMIRSATDSFLGHGQIQHPDFLDDPTLDHRLPATTLLELDQRLVGVKGLWAWSPRLSTGGLLSRKIPDPADPDDIEAWRAMTSEGAFLLGVAPTTEARVTILNDSILADNPSQRCVRGCQAARAEVYASTSDCEALCKKTPKVFDGNGCRQFSVDTVCAGVCSPDDDLCAMTDCTDRFADFCEPARFLSDTTPQPDNPYRGEVVLGLGLAKVLDVTVGDRVAMTTGTTQGRTYGAIYRVAGILRTGAVEINRTFAITHLDKLAAGVEAPGDASQIVFAVDNLDDVDDVVGNMRAAIADIEDVKAMSWKEIAPEIDIFMKIDQGSMIVMLVLMIMVVAVLLANVVTMASMERTREYGVRLAMGESPNRITIGLIVETFLLALVSSIIGLVIAEALVWYFTTAPIDMGMGEMESAGLVVNTVFHTKMTLYGPVFSVLTVWFFALIGSVIPAIRIRRLRPVEAIRFI